MTMSTKPPVSEEPENPEPESSQEGETLAMVKQMAAVNKSWAPTRKQIGMGAAIGVGSAAVVAALLYWRGGRK